MNGAGNFVDILPTRALRTNGAQADFGFFYGKQNDGSNEGYILAHDVITVHSKQLVPSFYPWPQKDEDYPNRHKHRGWHKPPHLPHSMHRWCC